jgi:hypothetical protein
MMSAVSPDCGKDIVIWTQATSSGLSSAPEWMMTNSSSVSRAEKVVDSSVMM